MEGKIKLNDKKTIRAWAMFDWANSAYFLVISTAVFPPFFTSNSPDFIEVFGYPIESASLYSFAVSFSYLFAAFLSPILSGIADYSGKRLVFLRFFTAVGSIFCGLLFFFKAEEGAIFAICAFAFATVAVTASQVFYNAFLPVIATEDRFDKVSAKGYAYGYIGSVLLLIFILMMIQFPHWFGITDPYLGPRIGFLLVGLWWFGFAQITFNNMPKDNKSKFKSEYITQGITEVFKVFKKVLKNVNLRRFLLSFFFFTAGVNTVVYLASIFAADVLGFETSELILVILILQLVAIVGAYLFAHLSEKVGNKIALLIQIFIWMGICVAAYFTTGKMFFYVLSGLVGLVLGGIQSLARSTYSKMVEQHKELLNSYFSFFDILYKVSVVLGTFIFGVVNQLTGNMRYSVLSIGVLFIIGFVFMTFVKVERVEE